MTAELRLQKALLLLDKDQPTEAEAILRELMAPGTDDVVERVRAHVILAEHFANVGREGEASELLTTAIAMPIAVEHRSVLELELELARDLLAGLG